MTKHTPWAWLPAILLAVQPLAAQDPAKVTIRLALDLADGSLLKGTTPLEQLPVHTPMGEVTLPLARVASMTQADAPGKFSLTLENGDTVVGEPRVERFEVETCFGHVTVPAGQVVKMTVSAEQQGVAKFDAAAGFSRDHNPADVWSYGWCAKPAAEFHLYQAKSPADARHPDIMGWTGEPGSSVAINSGKEIIHPLDTMTFKPRQLGLHPGPRGEYSVVRWTAPKAGRCHIAGAFTGLSGFHGSPVTTTDVAVYHGADKCFASLINLEGKANQADFDLTQSVEQGEVIDFVVGFGNGNFGFDSTGLDAVITLNPPAAR